MPTRSVPSNNTRSTCGPSGCSSIRSIPSTLHAQRTFQRCLTTVHIPLEPQQKYVRGISRFIFHGLQAKKTLNHALAGNCRDTGFGQGVYEGYTVPKLHSSRKPSVGLASPRFSDTTILLIDLARDRLAVSNPNGSARQLHRISVLMNRANPESCTMHTLT